MLVSFLPKVSDDGGECNKSNTNVKEAIVDKKRGLTYEEIIQNLEEKIKVFNLM
jgi:hypothetical protein